MKKRLIRMVMFIFMLATVFTISGKYEMSHAATTVTRGEWIHKLVDTFDMQLDESRLPDNYYSDIKGTTYYDDIILAVGYGVIDLEAGQKFEPNASVTREFATHTLNFCLGYQKDESEGYSFSDYEICNYPDDAQIALNRQWVSLVGGKFAPTQLLTQTQSTYMLSDASKVLAETVTDANHDDTWTLKSGIKEIPANIETSVESDVITLKKYTGTIVTGDIFVVHNGDILTPYKAMTVTTTGADIAVKTDTVDYSEVFDTVDAEGVIESDSLSFEAADGVNMQVATGGAASTSQKQTMAVKKLKIPQFSRDIKLSNGVSVTLKGTFKNVKAEYKILSASGTTYVKMSGDISISDSLKVTPSSIGNASVPLIYVGVPGVGGLSVNAEVKTSGKLTATVNSHVELGLSYSKADGIRSIKSFQENGGSNFTAEAEASIGVSMKCGITDMKVISGYVYADAGITAKFVDETYTDGAKPVNCRTFLAYMYAKYGAKASCIFMNKSFDETTEIYNLKNSPIRVYHHYEDGSEVATCMRGHTLDYFTKYYSKYWGTGWSKGYGAYGYGDDAKPYQIYEYTLKKNELDVEEATITKYKGNVSNLVIPDTIDGFKVVGIGDGAFANNSYLKEVTVPDSVTVIGGVAFASCSNLSSVNLSSSLITLGHDAFGSDTSLSEVVIPKSLSGCDINGYSSLQSGPFSKCSSLQEISFEEGTTYIAGSVFRGCTGLKSVIIPDTITSIGGSAFSQCTELEYVNLSNVTEIGDSAFTSCTKLKKIDMSNVLQTIWSDAFYACTSLEGIYIPKSLQQVKWSNGLAVHHAPFAGCSKLKSAGFEKNTTRIIGDIFNSCNGLESIDIPDTVTLIENAAFGNCVNLKSVTMHSGVTTIKESAFNGDKALEEVILPNTVKTIENYAFAYCQSLGKVTLSKRLETMGTNAFINAAITEIEIPMKLNNCTSNDFSSSEGGPFKDCSELKKVTFEEGTTHVAEKLFFSCPGIEEVILPETIEFIDRKAFNNCANLKNVALPKNLKSIAPYSFCNSKSLEKIIIPDTVTYIGEVAFSGCLQLKEVHIPKDYTSIPSNCFYNCEALETINIPKGITKIDTKAFTYCESLKNVEFPERLKEIGTYAFYGCKALEKLNINAEIIYNYAFQRCTSLKDVTLSNSVTSIGSGVFSECEKMLNIKLSTAIEYIPDSAFKGCLELTKIVLPYNVVEIKDNAFTNCTCLTRIVIPKKTTKIATTVFSYPDKLMIVGVKGSVADTYATENDMKFEALDVPCTGIDSSKELDSLTRGSSIRIPISFTPEDTSDSVQWYTHNADIATVSANGTVTGITCGKCEITVSAGKISKTVQVEVRPQAKSLAIIGRSYVGLKRSQQLECWDANGKVDASLLTWTSSYTSCAGVSEKGVVSGYSEGYATITAQLKSDTSIRTTFSINVIPDVSGEKVENLSIDLSNLTTVFTEYTAKINFYSQIPKYFDLGYYDSLVVNYKYTFNNGDSSDYVNGKIGLANSSNSLDGYSSGVADNQYAMDANGTETTINLAERGIQGIPYGINIQPMNKTYTWPENLASVEITGITFVAKQDVTYPSEGEAEPLATATPSATPTATAAATPTRVPTQTPTQAPTEPPVGTPSATPSTTPKVTPIPTKPANPLPTSPAPIITPTAAPQKTIAPQKTTAPQKTVAPAPTATAKVSIKVGKTKIFILENTKGRKAVVAVDKVLGAKGYQLQYALNKKFKKAKSKSSSKVIFKLKKLKKKKTYYFRVRVYKLNGKKKVYSKWSSVKKLKIKK